MALFRSGIMRNKKGGAPFVESTTDAGCTSVRSYGRTYGLNFRRFFPVDDLANTGEWHLEGELHRFAVLEIVYRNGLYLTFAVDVDVNAGDNAVGEQVNQLV